MELEQLILKLTELKKEHGNVSVRLQCDHGQELMRATWVGVSYLSDDSYIPLVSDEINDDCNIKVIEIQAF